MKTKLFTILLVFAVLTVSLPVGLIASADLGAVAVQSPIEVPVDNNQQVEYVGGWNPENYPTTGELYQGKIAVRKTIAPTETENYFDISLEVVAKQQYLDQSVDVIMVMDISNTMNSTHENLTPGADGYNITDSRLYEAKNAVNAFIDKYAAATDISNDRRFSLVTFNSYANVAIPLTKVDSTSTASIKASVNALDAPTEDRVRFTNIEGGLQLAYNLFKTSTAKYKYIIFVTDGFPTTYIESGRDSTTQIVGYDTFMVNTGVTTYDVTKVGTDGYFADSVTGKLALYGTSYSDKAAYRSATVAKQIKAAGINIFSIGIDVGVQSVPNYVDKYASSGFTVVDRTSTTYEIGSTTESYRNWLANTIAGGPLLESGKFEEHRYSAGNDQTALDTAFGNILADIKLAPSYTFRDAYTLDPMSDYVEFLHFYGYDGKAADVLVNDNTSATVATFDNETQTIDWKLINSKFTRKEGTDIFSAVITYRVRIKNEVEGFNPATALVANDITTFFFKTVDEDGNPLFGDNSINYPIPQIEAYLGELNFTKRDAESEIALTGASFTLQHYGSSCHYCEGGVTIADFHADTDDNGQVSFKNVPSGHEYVLIEDVAPEGYTIGASHTVTVAYGETYLHNEKIDDQHPGVVYNTLITPVTFNVGAVKNLDSSFTDRVLTDGEFSFIFSGAGQGGAVFHETSQNDAEGNVAFHPITFDMLGEYTFTVSEVEGEDSSIVYDSTVYTINVKVMHDNPENPTAFVLETTVNDQPVEDDGNVSLSFKNTVRESASAVITASKLYDGKTPEEVYSFELHGSDGELLQTKQNDGESIVFDTLYFGKAGIYNYSIVEVHGDDETVVYDHTVYDVAVVVTASDDGKSLVASVYYSDDGESLDKVVFNNNTRKDATLVINALKTIDGQKPEAGRFSFELRDADGNVVATATNDADGVIAFDKLSFNKVGDTRYTLVEVKGDESGVIYDETVYYLDIYTGTSHYSGTYILDVTVTIPADEQHGAVTLVHESGASVIINADHGIVFENQTKTPAAGDNYSLVLWLIVLAISGCAVVGTIGSAKKRQRNF